MKSLHSAEFSVDETKGVSGLAHGTLVCYVSRSMKLRLPALKEGSNPLDETLDPKDLGLDTDVFRNPVRATGVVVNDEQMLDIRLNIASTGHYTCDRCAIEFDRESRLDVRLIVMRREPHDSLEEDAEGLIFLPERETELDLSGEIVEAILLDEPMKKLCREDCLGLCPVCYTDWNEEKCEHFKQEPQE